MPESPRWLSKRGRFDEARHAIAVTLGVSLEDENVNTLVGREVEEIRSNVEYEKTFAANWIDCFKPGNKILYRTLLGEYVKASSVSRLQGHDNLQGWQCRCSSN